MLSKGSDTLESFFFESRFRKKLARIEHARIEHVLIVKVSFERKNSESFHDTHARYFRKRLSKENFLACHYLNIL